MLKENEVIMLILGLGVMFFILINRKVLLRIRYWKILFAGYCILLFGWFCTVLEGFFLEKMLNLLEHVSYLLSAMLLLVWVWRAKDRITREDI